MYPLRSYREGKTPRHSHNFVGIIVFMCPSSPTPTEFREGVSPSLEDGLGRCRKHNKPFLCAIGQPFEYASFDVYILLSAGM